MAVSWFYRQEVLQYQELREAGRMEKEIILESKITCPEYGHEEIEIMPVDACQWFYACKSCGTLLKPKKGIAAFFVPMERK